MTTEQNDSIMYQHYKGSLYEWMGTAALESKPSVVQVIYRSLDDGKVWVRPQSEFHEIVQHQGQLVPRFKQV